MVPDVMPLVLNPVPVAVTLEIVTLEFPLFVNVVARELVLPRFTFPKLRLVGFAPSRKVWVRPVPLKEMASGEPGAFLTIQMLPDATPTDVGRKAHVIMSCGPPLPVMGS